MFETRLYSVSVHIISLLIFSYLLDVYQAKNLDNRFLSKLYFGKRLNAIRDFVKESDPLDDARDTEANADVATSGKGASNGFDENIYQANGIAIRSKLVGGDLRKDISSYPVASDVEVEAWKRYRDCKDRHNWYKFTDGDIAKLLGNIYKIIEYYAATFEKQNVDGIFGLRVAETDLGQVLERLPRSDHYYRALNELHDRVRTIAEKAVSHLKKEGDEYSRDFMVMLNEPARYRRDYISFDKSYVMERDHALDAKEEEAQERSNECFQQMIGTGPYPGQECTMRKECLEQETAPGAKGYILTHQPLAFIVGENHGCHKQIQEMLGGSEKADEMYKKWANTIYAQWLEALVQDDIPTASHAEDLWYEQGLVAMLLGLVEASRIDQLRKAFPRLMKEGCCSYHDYQPSSLYKRATVHIGRCDSHKTSVYLGFLSSHLRFIFSPPPCEMLK